MKHRKFVKQLMSTGRDRNTAEHMARICQAHREPYAHAWERYKGIMLKRPSWWAYDFLATLLPLPDAPRGGARK